MRFTFVTTRPFHSISRLWFGFTASSRISRFGREPSNSTGGTLTHEVTNFTSARIPKLLEVGAGSAFGLAAAKRNDDGALERTSSVNTFPGVVRAKAVSRRTCPALYPR